MTDSILDADSELYVSVLTLRLCLHKVHNDAPQCQENKTTEYFGSPKKPVQQHKPFSNCGVFAIAFAYVICKGQLPELCMFNEGRLYKLFPKKNELGIKNEAELHIAKN